MTEIGRQKLSPIFRLIRGSNWWYAKIPPLLAIAYALLLVQTPSPGPALVGILGLLISLCSVAAYGHVVNDIFDVEEDQRAGQPNAMTQRTVWQRIFCCGLFVTTGFFPWIWVDFGPIAALVLVANYLFPTVYSAPPLRLKERGVWGIAADAAGVHAVPTLFVTIAFANLAAVPQEVARPLTVIATAWALAVGVRGILIHQLIDREKDRRAGTNTFVTPRAPEPIRRVTRWVIFPAETLLLAALVLLLFPYAPGAAYALGAYVLFDFFKLKFIWNKPFDPIPVSRGDYIPPHDLYQVWLPVVLAATLAVRNPLYLFLPAIHIALFYDDIKTRTRELVRVLYGLAKRILNWTRSIRRSLRA